MSDDFFTWMQHGIDMKWVVLAPCTTHEGIPMTTAEEEEFEQGHDPCIAVLRICEPEQHDNITQETSQ